MKSSEAASAVNPNHPIVIYDGTCGLCHGVVQFILKHDKSETFRFISQQSASLSKYLEPITVKELPDSIWVLESDGTLNVKSDAIIKILRNLTGIWKIFASLYGLLPILVRNLMYDFIAKRRYSLFGKKDNLCPVITPEQRQRFLDL